MQVNLHSIYSFHQLGARTNQEDSRLPDCDNPSASTVSPYFVVCDGVGGAEKSEVASATVCRAFDDVLCGRDWSEPFTDEDFSKTLAYAYKALKRKSTPENRGMATTLTFIAFHGGGCIAAHIGDSRIYQIRPEEGIIYRSEDHSLVNALVRSGNLSPVDVENHPNTNVITRSMTVSDDNNTYDEATVINLRDIRNGDYFFMCTDGVVHCIDDDTLQEILSSDLSDRDKIAYIADLCKNSDDNNTAILVHVDTVTDRDTPIYHHSDNSSVCTVTQQLNILGIDESVHEVNPSDSTIKKIRKFFTNIFH